MKLMPLYLIFSIVFLNPVFVKYTNNLTDSCKHKCKMSQKSECARCLNFLIISEEVQNFFQVYNGENLADFNISKLDDGIKKELLKPPIRY